MVTRRRRESNCKQLSLKSEWTVMAVNLRSKKPSLPYQVTSSLLLSSPCEFNSDSDVEHNAGVRKVEINRKQQKVSVSGYVEANKVLKKAKSTGKKAEIWPYVPYNLVAQPYIAQAYDKKAPPGYVRRVENTSTTASITAYEQDPYITMFSDDNPNACSIM